MEPGNEAMWGNFYAWGWVHSLMYTTRRAEAKTDSCSSVMRLQGYVDLFTIIRYVNIGRGHAFHSYYIHGSSLNVPIKFANFVTYS